MGHNEERGSRLYVGNIPFTSTEQDIIDLFSQHGPVSHAKVVTDHDTGRPRGFAFVQMLDKQSAEKALAALNGTSFGNRTLRIDVANERPAPRSPPPDRDRRRERW
jgi:RNA recognition motif-containing protein